MDYNELAASLLPKLKLIAAKYRTMVRWCDEDDALCEMLGFLWKQYNDGVYEGKTESFIVQSCYFHLRNCLRLADDRREMLSLEQMPREGGFPLEEVLPEESPALSESSDGRVFYDTVKNNGLSRREKLVFKLLYEGYSVREIGSALGVSHTMVLKYKRNIVCKVSRDHASLLV